MTHMKRREFIKSSLAAGIGLNGCSDGQAATRPFASCLTEKTVCPAPPSGKPHIVFIMSDQHRGDALHCMGNEAVRSPHIDRLAAEGTLFVSGYTSAPSSTPARAGLLTGLSPWHHGMLGYGRVAPHYTYEMPQMLRELGYTTYGIGKMHWFPQKSLHGFHATWVDESGRNESPDFISDYRLWFQLHAPGGNPDATGIGWNDHGARAYQLDERLHPTAWTGQTACELIRNYNDERPLFLKVSFARPHSPYDPPQRYLDLYKETDIPAPVIGDWCGQYAELKEADQVANDAPFANLGEAYAVNSRRHYYANITFIDDQIGEIVKALKEKGMYDNTLICYTADHGDMLGDHYHWRKTYPYEGSTKIPYIVKWPASLKLAAHKGKKVSQPVELRDFLPTFLEVAGGTVPPDMDGMSLLKLMDGREKEWRKYIDMEHATCYADDNYWCALTDGKIKYIWFFHTADEQLFDLTSDPGETVNLAHDDRYHNKLARLRQEMINHLKERGEGFVKDNRLVKREKTMLYSPNYPGVSDQ